MKIIKDHPNKKTKVQMFARFNSQGEVDKIYTDWTGEWEGSNKQPEVFDAIAKRKETVEYMQQHPQYYPADKVQERAEKEVERQKVWNEEAWERYNSLQASKYIPVPIVEMTLIPESMSRGRSAGNFQFKDADTDEEYTMGMTETLALLKCINKVTHSVGLRGITGLFSFGKKGQNVYMYPCDMDGNRINE